MIFITRVSIAISVVGGLLVLHSRQLFWRFFGLGMRRHLKGIIRLVFIVRYLDWLSVLLRFLITSLLWFLVIWFSLSWFFWRFVRNLLFWDSTGGNWRFFERGSCRLHFGRIAWSRWFQRFFNWLFNWFFNWLFNWFFNWFLNWLFSWFFDWLFNCLYYRCCFLFRLNFGSRVTKLFFILGQFLLQLLNGFILGDTGTFKSALAGNEIAVGGVDPLQLVLVVARLFAL